MTLDPKRVAIINSLDEKLVEVDSVYGVAKVGLEAILKILEVKCGGTFIPKNKKKKDPIWVSRNPLEGWQDSTGHISNSLLFEINLLCNVPINQLAITENSLGTIVPILWKNELRGFVVLEKTTLSEEEKFLLSMALNSIGREIYNVLTQIETISSEQYLTTLRIISATQSSELNLNDVQFWILKGIKDTFEGELAGLILVDPENPNIATTKIVGSGSEWLLHDTTRFDKGIVKSCVVKGIFCQVTDLTNDPEFEPEIDFAPNTQQRSIICSPLIVNSKTVGVVTIYNSPHTPLDFFDQGLLVSLTTSLSNSIYNNQLIQQLKIANADLEASSWELLNSRNTLRALFDSIPASIYIIDRNYNLVAINLSRASRAGIAPNLLVGKKCYDALHQQTEPCPSCQVGDTLLEGNLTYRNHRFWGGTSGATEWEISTYPILDNNNLLIQAIILEQDVTEKRYLETELIQSEKLAAVGQLAAGVAHEINNPLAAVIANAQILIRDLPQNEEDWLDSVKLIETAGLRAGNVVKNLLGLARKELYEFSAIDLNESIQNSLTLLSHEVLIRPIKIIFNQGEGFPKLVASRENLQSVWINIIMNAIEAIEDKEGEIHIATKFKDGEFTITIRDNGPGIQESQISKIFEPFFTTKSPVKGTGLGLSVVHRIIKSHGGRIKVESEIGRGTLFTIILPENKMS